MGSGSALRDMSLFLPVPPGRRGAPCLAPLELRRPLLQVRLNALLEVLAGEQRQELQEDVVDVRFEGLIQPQPHHPLGGLHGYKLVFMRRQATRAEITEWEFTNEYDFGEPQAESLF